MEHSKSIETTSTSSFGSQVITSGSSNSWTLDQYFIKEMSEMLKYCGL